MLYECCLVRSVYKALRYTFFIPPFIDRQTGRENSPSDGQKVSEDKGKDNISLSRRDVKSVSAFDRQKRRVDSTRDGQVTLDGQKVHILEKKEGDFHDNAAGMSEDAEKVGIIDDRQKVQVLETNSFKELEQLNRSEGSGKRLDPASGRKSGKYPHKKWNFRCSTGDGKEPYSEIMDQVGQFIRIKFYRNDLAILRLKLVFT